MDAPDSALYRLTLKVPTASQGYQGRAVIQATLDALEKADWPRLDVTLAERWGGHADERVSTRFFERLNELPETTRDTLLAGPLGKTVGALALRARTEAVQEHVIWTPLLDRIASGPIGREAIPDYVERMQSIHEWVRSQVVADAVVPLLKFQCADVVDVAIRNMRRLTPLAVKALADNPNAIARLVRENLYLRAEDGQVIWEWLSTQLVPGMPRAVSRSLEELVLRRLGPMASVRRVVYAVWTGGEEAIALSLLPLLPDDLWKWNHEERSTILERVVRIGDPSVAATLLGAGFFPDPDHGAMLARAFPVASVLDGLDRQSDQRETVGDMSE